ncbi:MAG: S4 domain-containing protein [Candidatus Cloacimonetes bacterium]|nr:S4 domain-containing protein [Candidatus Cloacimonadota bacterium]
MRIDQLLDKLCLVKSRNVAKKACELNLVKINDKTAKASSMLHDNDIVEYQIYGYKTKIKIKNIPTGNVSKKTASEYYEIIERSKIESDDQSEDL